MQLKICMQDLAFFFSPTHLERPTCRPLPAAKNLGGLEFYDAVEDSLLGSPTRFLVSPGHSFAGERADKLLWRARRGGVLFHD